MAVNTDPLDQILFSAQIALVILVLLTLVAGLGYIISRAYFWYLRFQNRSFNLDNKEFFKILVPPDNEIAINAAEQMFTSFYGLRKSGFKNSLKEQDHISFEIIATEESIDFYVVTPKHLSSLVEKQINATYPEAEFIKVEAPDLGSEKGITKFTSLVLKKADYIPITTYENLKVDTMNAITSSMSKLHKNEALAMQVIIRPATDTWQSNGKDYVKEQNAKATKTDKDGKPIGSRGAFDEEINTAVKNKISKVGYETSIRIVSVSDDEASATANLSNLERSIGQLNSQNLNKFSKGTNKYNKYFITGFIYRMFPVMKEYKWPFAIPHLLEKTFIKDYSILNTEELATLWHLPNKDVKTPKINWLRSKGSAAPIDLPDSGMYLGTSEFRGEQAKIFMEDEDRRRHMYILGTTGSGKSELLKFMAIQDINAGKGVCFVDPHGTAVQDLLKCIPKERMNDVIYFDPASDRPMGLNMLDVQTDKEKDLVINRFIDMLYELYDPNKQGIMGPQLERALRMSMLTAMSKPGGTLIEVTRLLIDDNFHKQYLPFISDPQVIEYWTIEVANTSKNRKGETLGYFVSKVDRFVTEKTMRYILGQQYSSFDFQDVMDNKKILLIDLAKGKLGEENSKFLGLILVPRMLAAAFTRIDRIERGQEVEDFYLYIDEFQNYTTPDIATILSEARKYKLNLIVANQFIGQLPDKIKDAIFGNVGTIGSFRIGTDDADYLQKYFHPQFTANDLLNNKVGRMFMKLLVKGQPSPPFAMTTDWAAIKSLPQYPEIADKIREESRKKYGRNKFIVDQEIRARSKF